MEAILLFLMALPATYGDNQCELVAKDFQREFGGSLIFLIKVKDGQYVTGNYAGHWVNKLYIKGNKKYFYFDWQSQSIFSSKEELKKWYWSMQDDGDVALFDISVDRPPFPLVWHY